MGFKLIDEIIIRSVSDSWETARKEWFFENAYQSEEPETCLCGHFPIINICVIKNTRNGNCTEVGNCCINKFLDIDEGNKIFSSVNRLKKDISKSMSFEALQYLNEKGILDNFEFEFYSSIIRKRKLSDKQISIKERINQKFIDFTSYEANSVLSKINTVLAWADKNKHFETTFVKSLKDSFSKKGKLSEKQTKALENIINKFRIE